MLQVTLISCNDSSKPMDKSELHYTTHTYIHTRTHARTHTHITEFTHVRYISEFKRLNLIVNCFGALIVVYNKGDYFTHMISNDYNIHTL